MKFVRQLSRRRADRPPNISQTIFFPFYAEGRPSFGRFHGLHRSETKTPVPAARARMPQITVKNGRSKLPRVSLMLLTLITPQRDFILSLFSSFRGAVLSRAESKKAPPSFLRFNFGRYTFQKRPVVTRGEDVRRLLGIVLNTL